ncbi:MAG: glycosyltransferase family 4 protein [Pseudomonadota bacterium]|jgi:glycosyltransferase involved in cell wall biosynthesis
MDMREIQLHYNIDHLVIKADVLLCWGWIFCEDDPLADLQLRLSLTDGRVIERTVERGKLREDVRDAFPQNLNAAASGFMIISAWTDAELTTAELIVTITSGVRKYVPIYQRESVANGGFMPRKQHSSRMGVTLALRAFRLIRIGHFKVFWEKMRRYFAAHPARVRDPAEALRVALKGTNSGDPALLVIDHDLGGGAPQYRSRLIEQRIKAGKTSLLLTFHVPTLNFATQVYGPSGTGRIALTELDPLLELAREGWIRDIYFNNSVSFRHPERVPDFICALRKISGGHLTLAVHDFNMLCPSHFLLNSSGKFCDVPATHVCASCLPLNQEGFVNFFPARDIRLWRSNWRKVIDEADELVFFSHSTKQLFLKAYPDVERGRLHVRPHAMDYFRVQPLHISSSSKLHIGVVGNIGRHKGSQVIAQLANTIKEQGCEARITIFGLIDEPVSKEVVTITGRYSHEELPNLIAKSGVNLMLLPSIVPETFSYVIHELIQMELPIVCFNLGAQADALRDYTLGRVIPPLDAGELLDALLVAHDDLRTR